MEKIKFKNSKNSVITDIPFDGQVIKVKNNITTDEKLRIEDVVSNRLKLRDFNNYTELEYDIIASVLHLCTNIDIGELDNVGIDNIVDSGLWDKIRNEIVNYYDVVEDIKRMEENAEKEKTSVYKFNLLLDKITEFVDKINQFDFNSKEFKSSYKKLIKSVQELSKVYPTINNNEEITQ